MGVAVSRGHSAALTDLTVLVPPGTPVRSLSAVAYYRLRDLVVTLELPPGAVLEDRQLMERLQLGRTPVREAVRRLSGEGLVRIFARRGTVVAPVDVRDLTHVSEVRTDLEALGAKLAAQRADSADRSRTRELLDEIGAAPLTALSATPGPEPVRSLIRLDQRVHHCVHRATHNRYLQETLSQYLTLSLRLWFLGLERVRRLEEAITEHRDVLTAVLDGDGEAAEQAARSHVSGFWQEMRRVLTG